MKRLKQDILRDNDISISAFQITLHLLPFPLQITLLAVPAIGACVFVAHNKNFSRDFFGIF